jgi:hypothetical protein
MTPYSTCRTGHMPSPWRTGCTTSIWPSSGEKVNKPMAKHVKALQAQMSPGSRARSEATAERLIREMALDELRAARADPGASVHDPRRQAIGGLQAGAPDG